MEMFVGDQGQAFFSELTIWLMTPGRDPKE